PKPLPAPVTSAYFLISPSVILPSPGTLWYRYHLFAECASRIRPDSQGREITKGGTDVAEHFHRCSVTRAAHRRFRSGGRRQQPAKDRPRPDRSFQSVSFR